MDEQERVATAQKVETGQAVAYLTSTKTRLGAKAIDIVIALIILRIGVAVSTHDFTGLVLFLTYFTLADGLSGGQSFGKKIVGAAVVDEKTRRPCTFFQSLVRNALLISLGIFDWLFIFGRKRQRLGDMAASTIVINVRPHNTLPSAKLTY